MKICTKCSKSKPLTGFHRKSSKADGRQSKCAECAIECSRAWYAANRDRRAKYAHAYYAANRGRVAEYRAANSEREIEYARAYRVANRERMAEYQRRREARKAGATIEGFTAEQLKARLSMFSGCWICGGQYEVVDHVKPLAKGGPHILANLRPACGLCNSRKKDRWPLAKVA